MESDEKRSAAEPKQVKRKVGRPKKDMSADKALVLKVLLDAAPGPKSATQMSVAQMAKATGFSTAKVKMLKSAMVEEGLLEAEERWAENGARLESSYRLTRKARRWLASYEGSLAVDDPGRRPRRGE